MDPNTSVTAMDSMTTASGGIVETWKLGSRISDYSVGELAIIQFYMGMLTLLGLVCNGAVLYLYFSTKSLRTPMNSLFISLTVGDMMVTVIASFTSFIHTILQMEMSVNFCALYGFFAFLGGTASGHALSVIALERFFTVARPFGIGGLTQGRANAFLAYTWGIALVIAASPLVGFSAYVGEGPGFWCSVEWEDDSLAGDVYIYFIFTVSYFFPITIIFFCYAVVITKIREVAKTAVSESSIKAEKAVIRQSVVMITGFIVAWTPYAIVCLVSALSADSPVSPKAALAPAMFAKTSTIWNPFIYIGMNKQFRQQFITKILKGKDPFEKKKKVDSSVGNTTYADKTAGTAPAGGNGNKVAPMEA